ncbi:hypothetical protein NOF55_18490 [Rhizobiaceae bacterium BDR2-2]|uniref:Uncharacterized protein n=1 Tax=Ectorhizobium quercum TaxID=2965071 RepID=A0AAE3SY33_9HYPH|nr:hypothetical protein [Ectorhizobium quercum]MCX8999100.1 hypothetical protein [Ectorhizobium quercum]
MISKLSACPDMANRLHVDSSERMPRHRNQTGRAVAGCIGAPAGLFRIDMERRYPVGFGVRITFSTTVSADRNGGLPFTPPPAPGEALVLHSYKQLAALPFDA